jgi:hypothetical protein
VQICMRVRLQCMRACAYVYIYLFIYVHACVYICMHADYATPLYPQKLALTSPTSGRSVGRYTSLVDSGQGACLFVLLFVHTYWYCYLNY